MKKKFMMIWMISIMLFAIHIAYAEDNATGTAPACRNLYWIDNTNKDCGQKEFCGMYMYYGLRTFESKEDCLKEAGATSTTQDASTSTLPVNENSTEKQKGTDCNDYFWFDNDNKLCQQENFCGEFMREGLRTFTTKEACLKGLVNINIADPEGKEKGIQEAIAKQEKESQDNPIAATDSTQPVACTLEYLPVCCNVRGDHTTEANTCNCEKAKQGVVLYQGECKKEDINLNPTNLQPGSSTTVAVGEKKVFISKDQKGDYKVKVGDKEADSSLEISEENSKVVVNTSKGKEELKILPDQAAAKAFNIDDVSSMKLEEKNGKAVYTIEGKKKGLLFAVIPVTGEVQQDIDADTGKVVSTKKPWWSFLAAEI